MSIEDGTNPAVVVVDPYTSGATLAQYVADNGYTVISLLSDPTSNRAKSALKMNQLIGEILPHSGSPDGDDPKSLARTVEKLRARGGEIRAVVAGAEEGVELADRVSHALGLPHNVLDLVSARRNKWDMMEATRAHGVRAAAQKHVFSTEEALSFSKSIPGWVVLKPLASMKSEDVFLCKTSDEVVQAFENIAGKRNFLNVVNEGALAQEYLDGNEYVVDAVSLDGRHKVNCLFSIDRGYANGQFNVMFGARLMDANSELDGAIAKKITAYASDVLDALGVRNGASHMELKVTTSGEACLIEMGARPCGDPVSPLLDACIHQNQLQQTIDALLHPHFFKSFYHDLPPSSRLQGRQCFVVSQFEGKLKRINEDALRRLPSVKAVNMFVSVGDVIEKTVDQRTQAGYMLMWHPDPEVLERDYKKVREMELTPGALFDCEVTIYDFANSSYISFTDLG